MLSLQIIHLFIVLNILVQNIKHVAKIVYFLGEIKNTPLIFVITPNVAIEEF